MKQPVKPVADELKKPAKQTRLLPETQKNDSTDVNESSMSGKFLQISKSGLQ